MKKKNKKLGIQDINKNTGSNVSNKISKIKDNEKKYVIILTFIFTVLFFIIGFLSIKIYMNDFDDYTNYLDSASYISLSSNVITLSDKDKINDNEALSRNGYSLSISNKMDYDVNYRLLLVEDEYLKEFCGCFKNNFNINDFKFSLDGKNIKNLMENMVLDTGHLDAKEIKKVNLNIWINKASMFDGHFHGMVVFELID